MDKQTGIDAPPADERSKPCQSTPSEDISFERQGCAALVTLKRSRVLNALTDEMRAQFPAHLDQLAVDPEIYALIIRSDNDRAFSVGGDVRELYDHGRAGTAMASLAQEYKLNWRLERFTKPVISLINGMVMGSGVGISRHGTHRIAGENYSFAMPEVAIGFFPDVGATWFLSHMDDEIGTYLGLTGSSIGRADAFALGLVTHCVDSDRFSRVIGAVAEADPIDPALDELHVDPGAGELMERRSVIAECFSGDRVEEIIERIEKVGDNHADWREATLTALGKNSPTSLKVTLRQLRAGRSLDLRRALQLEYRLAGHFLDGHDFYEGVRANLIDKDFKPVWEPKRLSDVSDELVDGYFSEKTGNGLELLAPSDDHVSNI